MGCLIKYNNKAITIGNRKEINRILGRCSEKEFANRKTFHVYVFYCFGKNCKKLSPDEVQNKNNICCNL